MGSPVEPVYSFRLWAPGTKESTRIAGIWGGVYGGPTSEDESERLQK